MHIDWVSLNNVKSTIVDEFFRLSMSGSTLGVVKILVALLVTSLTLHVLRFLTIF